MILSLYSTELGEKILKHQRKEHILVKEAENLTRMICKYIQRSNDLQLDYM